MKPTAGPLEAVSGWTQEGLEARPLGCLCMGGHEQPYCAWCTGLTTEERRAAPRDRPPGPQPNSPVGERADTERGRSSGGAPPHPTADPFGGDTLLWMIGVAEARDKDARVRTVNLKFSAATLRMWVRAARQERARVAPPALPVDPAAGERIEQLRASQPPERTRPTSPDSPSQGPGKQQLLDQDRAPSARSPFAAELFDAKDRYNALLCELHDKLDELSGADLVLEHEDFDLTLDSYDQSLELYGLAPNQRASEKTRAGIFALGFDRFWLNHRDGTQTFYSRSGSSEGTHEPSPLAGYGRRAPLASDKPPARPSSPSSASLESGGGTLDTTK